MNPGEVGQLSSIVVPRQNLYKDENQDLTLMIFRTIVLILSPKTTEASKAPVGMSLRITITRLMYILKLPRDFDDISWRMTF
jgi:hypothetical protein